MFEITAYPVIDKKIGKALEKVNRDTFAKAESEAS